MPGAQTCVPQAWKMVPDNVGKIINLVVARMIEREDYAGVLVIWCRMVLGFQDAVKISKHIKANEEVRGFGLHYTRKKIREFFNEVRETYEEQVGGTLSVSKAKTYALGRIHN